MAPSGIVKLNGLTDREAVMDAVLRFTWGLDQKDVGLLESAFTQVGILPMNLLENARIPWTFGMRDPGERNALQTIS